MHLAFSTQTVFQFHEGSFMRILKIIGIVAAFAVATLAVLVGYWHYRGGLIASKTYPVAAHHNPYTPDSAFIAHGRHVSKIIGCQDCHGADLAGRVMVDAPPFLVVPSNLTTGEGGVMKLYDDQQLELLIRHGVKKDGKAVFFMPSYAPVNDYDLSALAAFLRQLPAVDNNLPPSKLRFLGQVLTGAGLFPYAINVNLKNSDHPDFVDRVPSVEFGNYLTTLTCKHCHGEDLKGGVHPEPGAPYCPPLTASAHWSEEQFAAAIRSGVTPDGRQLNGRYMPWPAFSDFTDEELRAVRLYLESELLKSPATGGL
jgi:cytochrome c553